MKAKQNFQFSELALGTCYYPEQWERGLWEEDLLRMQKLGIKTIRIGEFAWSKVELTEGNFSFDFFDDFLDLAEKHKMNVIFGTPTATPPAWLTNAYPEVLNCTKDGVLFRHGMRRHYNYNSPKYKELCSRIVEKIAAHYAKRACIIGWQIDNEINCETDEFYSQSDSVAFREFLKAKYKTLEQLNDAWGTVFWNQTYTDWNEIFVPQPTPQNSTNPHQELDFCRFISASAIDFCAMQARIIQKYKKPNDFITTNGMFSNLDNHALAQILDIYTYDSYPNFAFGLDASPLNSSSLNDRMWSRALTEVRSICPHFGIMEQQSGAHGWNTRMEAPAPKPGQVELWAFQSIAHGADYVSFFRWRTATFGTEMYWHGILDYDNRDNRKVSEIKRISTRVQKLRDVTGSDFVSSVAILKDYDNVWDARVDKWHSRLHWKSEEEIFIACQLLHTPLDIVFLHDDKNCAPTCEELLKYKVLFYPHPLIAKEKTVSLLKEYVERGGVLVLGARAGQKSVLGKCEMRVMPGLFSELTGTEVQDYTFVGPADGKITCSGELGTELDTGCFNEVLRITEKAKNEAKVLCEFDKNYYAKSAALVLRNLGNGSVLHFGGTFVRETVAAILKHLNVAEPFAKVITLKKDCELVVRQKNDQRYFFILNFSANEQTAFLHQALTEVETQNILQGELTLSPYEVKVLTLPN